MSTEIKRDLDTEIWIVHQNMDFKGKHYRKGNEVGMKKYINRQFIFPNNWNEKYNFLVYISA